MHPILKLVTQRLALGLLLLLAASALIFIGVELLPGDVAQSILGQSATETALRNLREELGLNEPALTRYFKWLFAALQGDLGTALTNGQSISKAVGERLGNTLFLAFWAALFLGPAGDRSWPDRGALPQPLAGQADLRSRFRRSRCRNSWRLSAHVSVHGQDPSLFADLHHLFGDEPGRN